MLCEGRQKECCESRLPCCKVMLVSTWHATINSRYVRAQTACISYSTDKYHLFDASITVLKLFAILHPSAKSTESFCNLVCFFDWKQKFNNFFFLNLHSMEKVKNERQKHEHHVLLFLFPRQSNMSSFCQPTTFLFHHVSTILLLSFKSQRISSTSTFNQVLFFKH